MVVMMVSHGKKVYLSYNRRCQVLLTLSFSSTQCLLQRIDKEGQNKDFKYITKNTAIYFANPITGNTVFVLVVTYVVYSYICSVQTEHVCNLI